MRHSCLIHRQKNFTLQQKKKEWGNSEVVRQRTLCWRTSALHFDRKYPYKKKSRGIFSSWGPHEELMSPHEELMSPHEELMSPHESSWGLMRILKSSWAVFTRNFAHGFSAIAHEFWEMLMSLDELLVCSWALRDCSCRVMSLPFLTEKSWSRATHLKIGVTAVPMTTCHERGEKHERGMAWVRGLRRWSPFSSSFWISRSCGCTLSVCALFAQAAVLDTSVCLRSAGVIDADVPGLVHALAEAKF